MQCVRCGLINPPESKRCDCGQTLGAPIEKDWNERFERGQSKPRSWRIAVGAFLLVAKVGHFLTAGTSGLLQWPDSAERAGAWFGDALVIAGAIWLIYTGFKPERVRIPKN